MHIHSKYMTVKSITFASCCSGMWLIDSGVFNEQDFAPSLHSLTHILGPPSYPSHIPSSSFSGRATSPTDAEWVVTEPHMPSSLSDASNDSTTLVSSITMYFYWANGAYRRQIMSPSHLSQTTLQQAHLINLSHLMNLWWACLMNLPHLRSQAHNT